MSPDSEVTVTGLPVKVGPAMIAIASAERQVKWQTAKVKREMRTPAVIPECHCRGSMDSLPRSSKELVGAVPCWGLPETAGNDVFKYRPFAICHLLFAMPLVSYPPDVTGILQ